MSITSVALLARMVEINVNDYRRSFRPFFDRASAQRNFGLAEPESEIMNAFNHFAWVSERIDELERGGFSPEAAKSLQTAAEKDLELARRHIWLGRICCVEHLIEEVSDRIVTNLATMSDAQHENVADWKETARELDDRYNSLDRIEDISEETPVEEIRRRTDYLKSGPLKSLTAILADYSDLLDIVDEQSALPKID